MNLYRIFRTDEVGYDEYDSAVVAAESEQEARETCPFLDTFLSWENGSWFKKEGEAYEYGDHYSAWAHPDKVSAELIGTAKDGTERGVIVASFNAG